MQDVLVKVHFRGSKISNLSYPKNPTFPTRIHHFIVPSQNHLEDRYFNVLSVSLVMMSLFYFLLVQKG